VLKICINAKGKEVKIEKMKEWLKNFNSD